MALYQKMSYTWENYGPRYRDLKFAKCLIKTSKNISNTFNIHSQPLRNNSLNLEMSVSDIQLSDSKIVYPVS